jgi:hypothetical protein
MMFPAKITRGAVVGAVLGGAVAFAVGGSVLKGVALGGIVGGVTSGLLAYEDYMQARYGHTDEGYARAIGDGWRNDAYAIHDGSLAPAMVKVSEWVRGLVQAQDQGQQPRPDQTRRLQDEIAFLSVVANNSVDTDQTHAMASQRAQTRTRQPVRTPVSDVRLTSQTLQTGATTLRKVASSRFGIDFKMPYD